MHGAILAALVMIGAPASASQDPVALVLDLGSARFAEREAAEQALSKLGRQAIPALQVAQASPDPEVRTRAALVLQKIESALLVQPTLVKLDFNETRLADAITGLNHQAGLRLKLTPDLPALWADRRISIQPGTVLPFWKALDAVCQAGSLHFVFGGQNDFEQGEPTVALYDGFAAHQGRFNDQGPFRVQLASLHYQSEVHLASEDMADALIRSGAARPVASAEPHHVASRQFFLQLLVGAEPRLAIAPAGPVKVLEATDDQGRSLIAPTRGDPAQFESGYLGVNASPLVHLRVDLNYPDGPVKRLKRIKGSIPMIVSTRKPDYLEVGLGPHADKVVQQNGVTLTVGEVRLNAVDLAPTIELVIKVHAPVVSADDNDEDGEIRSLASPQQLEVLDAAGRMIPWFPSSSVFNGEEARLTLTLLDRDGPAQPTRIRYHGVIRDRAEVPFEFRDLPMP